VVVGRLGAALERADRRLAEALHRARRFRLLVGLRLRAAWLRASIDLAVAPDLRVGRGVRVTVERRTRSALRIAPHCAIGDASVVALRGGELVLGAWVHIRRGCQIEVAGRVEFQGPALVQHGTTVHCDESVVVGPRSVLSEYVTVVDSSHGTGEGGAWFLDIVRTEPVVIGRGVWVGAKATVARGVHLGDDSVVSANSLVLEDVPAGWLVAGVPASPVRPRSGGATAPATDA
jgi:acetyltransferase-like isoleucine patch superfamily enzyme